MLIKNNMFEKLFNNKSIFLKYNLLFLLMYLIIYFIDNIYLSILLIISAHVFSNIVFSLGMFAIQRVFELNQISDVTAKQYQISTVSMALISLMSGYFVQYIPYYIIIFIPFIIVYFLLVLFTNTTKNFILKTDESTLVK